MSEHNALKYGVDITRGVERIFGLDDHEQGVTRLSESLGIYASLHESPEYSYPVGEFRWAVSPSVGALAANFSQVGIRNPAASNVLVIIDQVIPFLNANAVIILRLSNAATVFGATSTPTQIDTRIKGFPNPSLATVSFTNQAAAVIGTNIMQVQVSANSAPILTPPIVLSPGFDLLVDNNLVNTAIQINFVGRERKARPGELVSF